MTLVRMCGFDDVRTYVLPHAVPYAGLLDLTVEEIATLCVANGGMCRLLYLVCKGQHRILDAVMDMEDAMRAKFGRREWSDLIR